MRNGAVLVFLSMLIAFIGSSHAAPPGKQLRGTLEQAWNGYLKACESGKESELQKTMSSFSLATVKNNLAKAKRSLTPELIRSMADDVPDITTAKLIKLLENGPTAGLLYGKDSTEKDPSGRPLVTFVFIKFVKESEVWKVDGMMNVDSPKFQKDGRESQFKISDLPETLAIDGKIRKSPGQAPLPAISGALDVFSYGYRTEVTINEVEQKTTVNKSYSGLIEGGLRKGKNDIVIRFTRVGNKTEPSPTVTIRRFLDNRNVKEVFSYQAKDEVGGPQTFTFSVE